ncbi:MAG: PIN domain-containing protein [Trueperaceae bacterium]|nr:MAG: PIN domain-containing protein [Trueperaceae bacterium]
MNVYLDTSALLPYYRSEAHSDAVEAFLRARSESVDISDLTLVEVASALARWVRQHELSEAQALTIERALDADVDAGRFSVQPLTPRHTRLATRWLLGRQVALRTLDALHLACAAQAGAHLVTLDRTLAREAVALGIATHDLVA